LITLGESYDKMTPRCTSTGFEEWLTELRDHRGATIRERALLLNLTSDKLSLGVEPLTDLITTLSTDHSEKLSACLLITDRLMILLRCSGWVMMSLMGVLSHWKHLFII
jgi:hypothetical protein